jgi:hypothetical protein
MKTLQSKSGEIRRVKNQEAETLAKLGWKYVPKSEWKKKR